MSGTSYLPDSAYAPKPGRPIKAVGGQLVVGTPPDALYWELLVAAVVMVCRKYNAAPVGTLVGGSHEVAALPAGARLVWFELILDEEVPPPVPEAP